MKYTRYYIYYHYVLKCKKEKCIWKIFVKYTQIRLSNTNTNTNILSCGFSNTNTNTNTDICVFKYKYKYVFDPSPDTHTHTQTKKKQKKKSTQPKHVCFYGISCTCVEWVGEMWHITWQVPDINNQYVSVPPIRHICYDVLVPLKRP